MAKRTAAPSRPELAALFDIARRLREARPWEAMSDADVFGVRDPESGEVGYCSVMGQLREYFGLHVYLGAEGIASYRGAAGAWDQGDGGRGELNLILAGLSQKSLAVEYQSAAELPGEEKALIRDLGLSFRGRHAWPSFRRHDPGLEPWPLNGSEARFLTAALEQALVMAGRFVSDEAAVRGPLSVDRVLVRVPTRREGATTWDDVVELFEPAPAPTSDPLPDQVRRALEELPRRRADLELAHSFLPAVVQERKGQRGMFPRLLLLVERERGLIVGYHVFGQGEFPGGVLARVAGMLLKLGARPRHLMLCDPWLHRLLFDASPCLRPSLVLVPWMEAAEAAYASLTRMMAR